jgi:soluble cytochrome b562
MRTRSKQLNFRLLETEYNSIKQKAVKAKLSISRYLILSAINKKVIDKDELKEINHLLKKLSGNINQIAILANQGKITIVDLHTVKEQQKELLRGFIEWQQ